MTFTLAMYNATLTINFRFNTHVKGYVKLRCVNIIINVKVKVLHIYKKKNLIRKYIRVGKWQVVYFMSSFTILFFHCLGLGSIMRAKMEWMVTTTKKHSQRHRIKDNYLTKSFTDSPKISKLNNRNYWKNEINILRFEQDKHHKL